MKIIQSIKQINRNIKTITRPIRDFIAKLLLDKKLQNNKKINLNELKTVLFLRDDNKIGDMVVSTILFREIKKKYPKIKIMVLTGKDSKEIIKYNPYVDEILETNEKLCKNLAIYFKLREYKIDVIIDTIPFDPRPAYLLKLRIINPDFLIGYDKQRYNVYDYSIQVDKNVHITKKYEKLLNFFDIYNPSLYYDIFLGDMQYDKNKYINDQKNKIVINPFAASIHKTFKFDKLQELVDKIKNKIQCNIFILCQSNNYNQIKNIQNVTVLTVISPLETAYLVSKCDFIISPDTSVVHIARVFNKKMIVLYLDCLKNEEQTGQIWAPGYDDAVQIFVDTKNGKFENDICHIDNDVIVNTLLKKI